MNTPGSFKCQCDVSKGWTVSYSEESPGNTNAALQKSFGYDGKHSCQGSVITKIIEFSNLKVITNLKIWTSVQKVFTLVIPTPFVSTIEDHTFVVVYQAT